MEQSPSWETKSSRWSGNSPILWNPMVTICPDFQTKLNSVINTVVIVIKLKWDIFIKNRCHCSRVCPFICHGNYTQNWQQISWSNSRVSRDVKKWRRPTRNFIEVLSLKPTWTGVNSQYNVIFPLNDVIFVGEARAMTKRSGRTNAYILHPSRRHALLQLRRVSCLFVHSATHVQWAVCIRKLVWLLPIQHTMHTLKQKYFYKDNK
jgi:hypothetical protein